MSHPLVDQFRFTRAEWLRGLEGVTEEDATRHFGSMNCISWNVGHLAWHEQRYWLENAQDKVLFSKLDELCCYGAPMATPSLAEMLDIWHAVTKASNPYLDSLTTEKLLTIWVKKGNPIGRGVGSALRRITYHYWYHIGETQAIRQILGHQNLAEYVGDIEKLAPYRPEE